ncbi:hypothetical protein BN2905_12560 [Achromobacter xylosoxidans]|nr:hypothetical protein BN2905_12560 [Achromobacter xylosoxidans]
MHPGFLQAEHLALPHRFLRISPDLPLNAKTGRPRGRFWRPRKIFRPD